MGWLVVSLGETPILAPCHAHGLGVSMGISGVSAHRMGVPGWELWTPPDLSPPRDHLCRRSSSFTFDLVAGGGCLFVSEELAGHSASWPKGPCSAFLATGWENKGLLLPSAEKPLIRGRGTWLQPIAPLSRGQSRSAAEIWEVVGCAPVLIWEALGGDLAGLPLPPSQGPGHTHRNKTPAVTLPPFITQFPAFHHRHKGHSVSPCMGRGLGRVPLGTWGQLLGRCHP